MFTSNKFHVFRDKHLDDVTGNYLGFMDFRDEFVQQPTMADYQIQ